LPVWPSGRAEKGAKADTLLARAMIFGWMDFADVNPAVGFAWLLCIWFSTGFVLFVRNAE
jgi:hypothetical protein